MCPVAMANEEPLTKYSCVSNEACRNCRPYDINIRIWSFRHLVTIDDVLHCLSSQHPPIERVNAWPVIIFGIICYSWEFQWRDISTKIDEAMLASTIPAASSIWQCNGYLWIHHRCVCVGLRWCFQYIHVRLVKRWVFPPHDPNLCAEQAKTPIPCIYLFSVWPLTVYCTSRRRFTATLTRSALARTVSNVQ